MCGIIAILDQEVIDDVNLQAHLALLDKRGPDFKSELKECRTKCGLLLRIKAAILHMRGCNIQLQPVVDSENNILLFNGQIYEFNNQPLDNCSSDTSFLSSKLKKCVGTAEISSVLSSICGPFSIIYWREDLSCLFFGRDVFGRKSLCQLTYEEEDSNLVKYLALSSLARNVTSSVNSRWSEVDCSGLHCLEFSMEGKLRYKFMLDWNIEKAFPKTSKCTSDTVKGNPGLISMPCPFVPLNKNLKESNEFSDKERQLSMNQFKQMLTQAISKRIRFDRKICLDCRKLTTSNTCNHSKYAVAFSGGVDSTLLAVIMDKLIDEKETIDLLTVAFKEGSPDRMSVFFAFRELRQLSPNRCWRLVICDISIPELVRERDKTISHLIAPCAKVVDDSLGCACYFIGRGIGRALDSTSNVKEFDRVLEDFIKYNTETAGTRYDDVINVHYVSPAATLFLGSGIDEQLGGYSSHRAAWSCEGTCGVYEEISFQMRRISERNLGRDDRIYSHHSRDTKLPYLDLQLVNYLNQLPIGLKMNLNENLTVGPKKLLRDLAFDMGLRETSKRIKRALQFGTRIANLEQSREKGNDFCSRLA